MQGCCPPYAASKGLVCLLVLGLVTLLPAAPHTAGAEIAKQNKMKPTNPNADTYVEKQKQYLFIAFSSEPTCGTP